MPVDTGCGLYDVGGVFVGFLSMCVLLLAGFLHDGDGNRLCLGHERLESVKTLLEGRSLSIGQIGVVHLLAERMVAEMTASGLLLDPKIPQNTLHDLHLEMLVQDYAAMKSSHW